MIISCDNIFRIAGYEKLVDEGLSKDLAVKKLNKSFPYYGDPDDTTICSGEDRPLPYEIKDRANSYMIRCNNNNFIHFSLFKRPRIFSFNRVPLLFRLLYEMKPPDSSPAPR
jgi:hypothetical protein